MEPYSHEKHKQHAFDSFCKKILKNEALNYSSELNRQREREVSLSELSAQEMDMLFSMDKYPSEIFSFSVLNFDVEVNDERIGEALAALPEEKRDIILLHYFLGMTDGEIGNKLNLLRSSVQQKRTRALRKLEKFMEGKA